MRKQHARLLLLTCIATLCTLAAAAQNDTALFPLADRRGTLNPEWALRRTAGAQDKGPGGNYFKGEKNQLVVLASFADNPFLGDSAATLAQWDKILNTRHLDEPPFTGSFHDYFYDQSYGLFDLSCDLQFVRVDSCRRYASTASDDENSQYLVQDVMNVLRQRDIEWDRYDWNGDGYVNQLLIIYAGQGSAYGKMGPRYDAIWPHQWWLSQHRKDRQTGIYCDPETVHYQDNDYLIDSYCAVQELHRDSTYGSFGTLCHEFSHCFGFPDIYYGSTSFIYKWDLMDYGNYTGGGFLPTGYSAHERWLMDWLTPAELTTPTIVTDMPALTDQPVAYLIRNDACPDEFYLLENRQQTGWDAGLPGAGLTVFHIDYSPLLWLLGNVNTPNLQHYVIIQANNRSSISAASGWAYPCAINDSTWNTALTDTSVPAATLWNANIAGEMLMSKPVTDIAVNDGLASFSFMSPTQDLPAPLTDPATPFTDSPASLTGNPSPATRKFLHNGHLLIQFGNNIYTPFGQIVATGR